uniref:Discoidin, CUB and LCCL domain containing 2 n=1 Tax=Oryzias melastigma TaxID=30732 RepID=A0A3B3C023_ORYME
FKESVCPPGTLCSAAPLSVAFACSSSWLRPTVRPAPPPRRADFISNLLHRVCCPAGDGCGPSVLGPSSGTLSSRGYPGTYPNDSVCEWEISVPPKKRIHFRFALLDIEDNNCQVNYLRLYNGIGSKRSEIEKYCGLGLKVEKLIETSDHKATVQFRSGTHHTGRGFYLSYSTTDHPDLITCLDKGTDFSEAEFSKYCPAGCSTSAEEVSGTIPKGYREVSWGAFLSPPLSPKTPAEETSCLCSCEGLLVSGCYGTLGLESGVVANSQLAASSSLNSYITGQDGEWGPSGARLKQAGLPWAPSVTDDQQWLQVDLRRETRITGIITTGSTLREYPWFVSEYRVLFSNDGREWSTYTEANSTQPKSFQGNVNYLHEVRNNFIPPIEARFVRINPVSRHPSRVALKLELLGCRLPAGPEPPWGPGRSCRHTLPTKQSGRLKPQPLQTSGTPLCLHKTVGTHQRSTLVRREMLTDAFVLLDVSSAAVLVSVLVVVPTVFIVIAVCAWHCKNKKKNSEGTYDLPQWDSTDWWKSMKQLLPSKMLETEETNRYFSRTNINTLTPELSTKTLEQHSIPLVPEYAQPLVSGVTTLGARSTFKPDEGPELYDAPVSDAFHAYAEPLPASGSEYATPIVVDMGCHLSSKACGFMGPSSLHARTDSERSEYDTPKNSTGQATPTEELTYQVPQVSAQKAAGEQELEPM